MSENTAPEPTTRDVTPTPTLTLRKEVVQRLAVATGVRAGRRPITWDPVTDGRG